ncbi:hypothetical protein HI914_04056 [Erysiphe necator]|nr:hypothetical protein HI914_04056 [Erysiphe necator]
MENTSYKKSKKKQRKSSSDHENKAERFHEGKVNSHLAMDSSHKRDKATESEETRLLKIDPTLPARMHGNEPSRGAKIDAQIQKEEKDELKKKGKA